MAHEGIPPGLEEVMARVQRDVAPDTFKSIAGHVEDQIRSSAESVGPDAERAGVAASLISSEVTAELASEVSAEAASEATAATAAEVAGAASSGRAMS
jgi:hypothetical protein